MPRHRLKWDLVSTLAFFLYCFPLFSHASQEQVARPRREPIRVGGNVQENKLLYRVNPNYPPEAKVARISGVVILQATINEAGEVADLRVLRGHPLLDDAAVAAVSQWRYSPTLLNGEPVSVIATVTVIFNLSPGLALGIDEVGNLKDGSLIILGEELTRKLNESQGIASITPDPQLTFQVLEESLRSLQKAGAKEFRFNGPYVFREGRLFYSQGAPQVQPPEIALETERLAQIAKSSGRTEGTTPSPDGRKLLLYRLFLNEIGEILHVQQLRGPQIPELETELLRTRIISPGRRGPEPVPFAVLVEVPVD